VADARALIESKDSDDHERSLETGSD